MALHPMQDSGVNNIVFSIADQLNKGEAEGSPQCPDAKLDLARLNETAGVKAMELSDYVTAHSYLDTTLALLPEEHWESHYDLRLA